MGRLICIVGLHGSGKTTAGRYLLQSGLVASHVSIGDLARIGRRAIIPNGVPTRLMTRLARHKPGTVFEPATAILLADYFTALSSGNATISVDGFPSSPDQIALLPSNTEIWHTISVEQTRHDRLEERGNKTNRKWVNGGPSERDNMLEPTLDAAKQHGVKIIELKNDQGVEAFFESCSRLVTVPH